VDLVGVDSVGLGFGLNVAMMTIIDVNISTPNAEGEEGRTRQDK
jgi:hypothetical protein